MDVFNGGKFYLGFFFFFTNEETIFEVSPLTNFGSICNNCMWKKMCSRDITKQKQNTGFTLFLCRMELLAGNKYYLNLKEKNLYF